jgi:hypothetical protein
MQGSDTFSQSHESTNGSPSSSFTAAGAVKYVVKRDGTQEPLDFVKLRKRFEAKSDGLNMEYINFDVIVAKLASGIY